jgi:uncharacterized phiE125 gp8 family phage protein
VQGLVLSDAPAEEPVSLEEAKQHLRVEIETDDALITSLIMAAREHVEMFTRRQLVTATWVWTLDGFLGQVVRLPKPPLQAITTVAYLDGAGTPQTLDASLYHVNAAVQPGVLTPAFGRSWPTTREASDAVTITYVAGYGAAAAVPATLKAAIVLLVGDLYEHREARSEMRLEDNPTVLRLLWGVRVLEA